MVEYAVSDLVKEVKVLLDRNQESAGLLAPSDSDTLSQAELIESKIVDAARIILSDAPEDMVEGTSCTNAVTWTDSNGYYVGNMILPTDMLRILSVKAEGWNRPAEIISESDDAYKYQNCKYGVRGNPERPVAALIHKSALRCLRYNAIYDDTCDFYARMLQILYGPFRLEDGQPLRRQYEHKGRLLEIA